MRLRLEDNGNDSVKLIKTVQGNKRTIYNPQTGEGLVLNTELGGRKWWKVVLDPLNVTGAATDAVGLDKTSRDLRKREKLERLQARLDAKQRRQSGRATRKKVRINRGIKRQKNKTQAQQEEFDREQAANKSGAYSPIYQPEESDELPEDEFYDEDEGGDFETQNQAQTAQQETEDIEYEEVPDDAYDNEGYDNGFSDNSQMALNGWVDDVWDEAKKVLGITKKTPGQSSTIYNVANAQVDYPRLKKENEKLKKKIKQLETQNLIYGGSGLALGVLGGVFVGKSLKN